MNASPDTRAPVVWGPQDLLILELLARNTPHSEVAQRLSCSVSTVERRLVAMRRRIGASTTIEVVVQAVRSGQI